MLILEMILKITGFTQDELANYLGVSRQSVNYWLSGDPISEKMIRNICGKFSIPISYFNVSLNENIECYKIIYSTIYNNWKNNTRDNSLNDQLKIKNILNEIETLDKNISVNNDYEISDEEILDALKLGCNPFTGELLDNHNILSTQRFKDFINNVQILEPNIDKLIDSLSEVQKKKYDKLLEWRNKVADEQQIRPRYYLLNRKEMYNLVISDIRSKSELLKVKGIGTVKYQKYSDELFKLLNDNDNKINPYSKFGNIDKLTQFNIGDYYV